MRKGGKLVWVVVFLLLMPAIAIGKDDSMISQNKQGNEEEEFMPLNDEIDQQQTIDNYGSILWSIYGWAQSFKPSLDILTRVQIKLAKIGNIISPVHISITENLHGFPIVEDDIESNQIESYPGNWIEFDFPDIKVRTGHIYYIVCTTTDGDPKEGIYYDWRGSREDTYPYGDKYCCYVPNNYWFKWSPPRDLCFITYGRMNQMPGKPSKPQGSSFGIIGKEYIYKTTAVDPDGDRIRYGWDWNGDNVIDEWTNYYDSGVRVSTNHTWNQTGTYKIKVKAQDEFGGESNWSEPVTVIMPFNVNQAISQKIMEWLLEVLRSFFFPLFKYL